MTKSDSPLTVDRSDAPCVLITGASSGIGHASARRFAARGWRVWASMRRPEVGEALRTEARDKGWSLQTPALDVTSDASVADAVSSVLSTTGGRLDLLLNNAGYFSYGVWEESTPDELRAQFETNVVGAHRVARAVLPAMRARRQGRIVFIGSISGLVALPVTGPYHASKWAIEAMAESLRYEVRALGVDVVLIEPGPFKTALHANERAAAAAGNANSPYAGLHGAYEKQARALPRAELDQLLATIERASTQKRPALRWPVGPKAFSAAYLRRFAPDWLYELVVRLAFRT